MHRKTVRPPIWPVYHPSAWAPVHSSMRRSLDPREGPPEGAPSKGLVKSRENRSRNSRPSRFRHRASISSQSDPLPIFRIASRIRLNRALQCPQTLLRWEQTFAFSTITSPSRRARTQILAFEKLNSLLTAVTPSFFVGLVQKIGFAKLNSPLTAVSPSFFVGRWLSFLFIGPGPGTATSFRHRTQSPSNSGASGIQSAQPDSESNIMHRTQLPSKSDAH